MKKSEAWVLLGCVCAVWFLCVGRVLPFDFDEAFYRRVAEEMFSARSYLRPVWDAVPVFDKPPFYLWFLGLSGTLVDGTAEHIGALAARLPSLVSSIGSILMLCLCWPRLVRGICANLSGFGNCRFPVGSEAEEVSAVDCSAASELVQRSFLAHPAFPGLLYCLALIPGAGAGAILLDPLLSLCLTPALLLLTLAWMEGQKGAPRPLSLLENSVLALSLGLATATKGLIGFLVPGLAVVVQLGISALVFKKESQFLSSFYCLFGAATRRFVGAFALGAACAAAYYFLIWHAGGQDFVREFFLTHHFKRGSAAMEGHSGGVAYHFVVVLFGGYLLSALLLNQLAGFAKARRGRWLLSFWPSLLFPASWVLAFLLFFSCMATKLPNYTWPVWPAFALLVGILAVLARFESALGRWDDSIPQVGALKRCVWGCLTFAPAVVIGLSGVLLAAAPFLLNFVLRFSDPRARAVISAAGQIPFVVQVGFALIGVLLMLSAIEVWSFRKYPGAVPERRPFYRLVRLTAGIVICAGGLVLPFVSESFTLPLVRLARRASQPDLMNLPLTTLGLKSPTVSSFYKGIAVPSQKGANDDTAFRSPNRQLIMLPVWKEERCQEFGFSVVARDRYLLLCVGSRRGNDAPSLLE